VLAIGNTSGSTDINMDTTQKVQFRDAAIYINSSVDGQLDIVADTEIQIAATTIDINGAINASGEIIAASLDISGDIDVDGTTNLDVVDIDGAVDMASTLAVADTTTIVKTASGVTKALKLYNNTAGANNRVAIDFHTASTLYGTIEGGYGASSPEMNFIVSSVDNLKLNTGGAVFNESSADIDFRVESDAITHALFVDGSSGNVGINTSSSLLDTPLQVYTATSAAITPLIKLQGSHSADDSTEGTSIDFVESADQTAVGSRIIGTRAAAGANMDLRFHTGRDNFAMIIDQSQYVGMGTDDPLTPLHIKSTAAGEMLRIESTEGGTSDGPILGLHRNSASPADGDGLGTINFYGEDSAGNITTYAQIRAESSDVSNGTEDGFMSIRTIINGTDTARLNLTLGEAVFNESGADLDFRVESDGNANMLFVDGGNNKVGIGTNSLGRVFNVYHPTTDGAIKLETGGNSSSIWSGIEFRTPNSTGFIYVPSDNSAGLMKFLPASTEVLALTNSAVIVNETGSDVDFRVESDTNANMLFVDGGNNRITMGGNDGTGSLTVKNVDSGGSDVFIHAQNPTANRIAGFKVLDEDGDAQITLQYDNGGDTPSLVLQKEGLGNMSFSFDGSNSDVASNSTSAVLNFKTSSTTRMSISVGGGITTTPLANKHAVFNEDGVDADFRVESDTNANMFVVDASTDRVGVGVAAPLETLHVAGSVFSSSGYYITVLQGNAQLTNASTSSGSNASYIGQGLITVVVSDAKAKENFGAVEENECLNKIVSLSDHVKKFDWIDEDWKREKGRTVGMVAQEVYEDHSEFVHKPENYNDDGWAIRYQEIVPTLIKAFQEQQELIKTLEARITALES
jgi:cytoskeletal protein CcmA (bactofilin family)